MLVLLSDLHFMDGTAGEHNILSKTFEEVMSDVRQKALNVKASEIKLVFLGDIFDPLRTEKWFEVPMTSRPWGVRYKEDRLELEKHANTIMDAILRHPENKKSFEALSGNLAGRFGFRAEPERIYVVGNHDRLCAQFPSLYKKAQKALNASNNAPLHYYIDKHYGLFARHGHEYDFFNYEGSSSFTDEDYLKIPIGDVIATELVAKLPYMIMKHERVQALRRDEREILQRNLQEIQSVRPMSAIMNWLFYQVEGNDWLADIVEDCLTAAVKDFRHIDFVRTWMKQHSIVGKFSAKTNSLRLVLYMLQSFSLKNLGRVLRLADSASASFKSSFARGAADAFKSLDSQFCYVAFGHTHVPLQLPINVENRNQSSQRELVYINTGTWVDRYYAALEKGFVNWNNITYTIFYNKEEAQYTDAINTGFPTFETWNGALKKQKG